MFVGRKKELNTLNRLTEENKFHFVSLYGRRRVGKTELLNEFITNSKVKGIYFFCRDISLQANASYLNLVLKTLFIEDNISINQTFEEAIEFIFKKSLKEPLILALDEFPNLQIKNPEVNSLLQSLVDKYYKESKLLIIVSGSYIKTMENITKYDSPLYGRIDTIIKLLPFDYYESSLFYKNMSNVDKVNYYACFGGLPLINQKIDNTLSFENNLKRCFIDKSFYGLGGFFSLIQQEFDKITNASILINLIALGTHKYTDLKDKFNMIAKAKNVDYLLNQLIDLDIIEKVNPINTNNKKLVFYHIKDNSVLFYYRYIYPNIDYIEMIDVDTFFDKFIKKDLYSYFIPNRFESLSKEFLIKRNIKNLNEEPFLKIGKYFYNNSKNKINLEFDIVTYDFKGFIQYECKFTSAPIDNKFILEEESQIKKANLSFYKLGFISKAGFTNDIDKKKYILFNLDDIYDEKLA